MDNFTPVSAALGGGLIGLASALLLLGNGRIAGISGIVSRVLLGAEDGRTWRILFLAGLVLGTLLTLPLGISVPQPPQGDTLMLVVGGLLVGGGSALGSGCTSGHGVCGLGRLSKRSLIATLTFMASAIVTVWLVRG